MVRQLDHLVGMLPSMIFDQIKFNLVIVAKLLLRIGTTFLLDFAPQLKENRIYKLDKLYSVHLLDR